MYELKMNMNKLKQVTILAVFLLAGLLLSTNVSAQPPFGGGPGGPGGPGAPDQELVAEYDADENGYLDADERKKARESLNSNNRRGGPGGRGGRGGRGRGGRPAGSPGPKVDPADVENFPEAGLYDENVLRTIFLEFEQDDWEKELADFKPTDVEVPATMMVDGKTYSNVGVSFRGASSFFMVPEGSKRSLNISMDLVEDKQRLYGYKSLNLLNCNGDASMMSSYLYAHIASQKIATPKVNFVKVVINGRSWGVYANAQQFNKDMLKENYDTKKGTRWKVSGSPRGDAGLRYLGEDLEPYRSRFDIKSKDNEESWRDLVNLCKVLNETPTDQLESVLDPILDVDGVLWFLAVDVALINSDGYWTRASDYSIYLDPDGKFHILPHDMNESFRASRGGGPGGGRGGPGGGRRGGRRGGFGGPPDGGRPPQDGPGRIGPPENEDRPPRQGRGERPPERGAERDGRRGGPGGDRGGPGGRGGGAGGGYELDPLVGIDEERFPLRSKLLENERLKERYLQYVKEIAEDQIAWEHLGKRVESARKLIEDEVQEDTRKLMAFDDFQNATDGQSPARPGSLREFSEKRSEYLLNHPAIRALSNGSGRKSRARR